MITAIVEYQLPSVLPRDQVQKIFSMAESKFRRMDGLHKKYFGYDERTGAGTSVYVWSTPEHATRCFSPQFVAEFERVFNTRPTIRYVDILILVDNDADKVTRF